MLLKNPLSLQNKGIVPLFDKTGHFDVSRYPWAYKAWERQQQIHWLGAEVPLHEDVKDWTTGGITADEKNLLTQIFRLFTESDVHVAENYAKRYMPIFKPLEIQMMFMAFMNMETVHIDSYSLLVRTIGMPETEFKAFKQYAQMMDKVNYMDSFGVGTVKDVVKTLAMFGAFTEGLSLFASFAMLMNFPRFNKMKGMGQIVTWSIRDECVSDDTEVLTPKGWVSFPDFLDGESVAQYNHETKEISFVVPKRVVRKQYDGVMYGIEKRQLSLSVTPNHDILYVQNGEVKKQKASDFCPHDRKEIPITGIKNSQNDRELTYLERLKIAYAADGCRVSSPKRTGKKCGYQRVMFSFTKERKIERLLMLCKNANVNVSEMKQDKRGQRRFSVDIPAGHAIKDLHEWVDIQDIGSNYAKSFIEEMLLWDGHISSNKKIFCTTNKKDAELAQILALFCNLSTSLITSMDTRKETYKNYFRVCFWDNATTPSHGKEGKKEFKYTGTVYCVEVPCGNFVIRKNGCVSITGNSLHCEGVIRLYHELFKETGMKEGDLIDDITSVANTVVSLEDKFIELAFELGDIQGMRAEDIKAYIRYIADWRLTQLRLRPVNGYFEGSNGDYTQKKEHPLPWLTAMLNGVEHANFFETRATEYSKGATKGKWEGIDGVWSMFNEKKR